MIRFAQKYFYAKLLSNRLFGTPDAQDEAVREFMGSMLYRSDPPKQDKIMALDSGKLQQLVKNTWSSCGEGTASITQKEFVNLVVAPALRVNTSAVPSCFADVIGRFSASLHSGQFSESDQAKLKLASAALDGTLSEHPLISGLALQCIRMVRRHQRGMQTMAGRREACTDEEARLIADAGMQLAICGGNRKLAAEFGVSLVTWMQQ